MNNRKSYERCDVCGALTLVVQQRQVCNFCKFEKSLFQNADEKNENLICAKDINDFFNSKYSKLNHGETFELSVPVIRFYKKPLPLAGQINFFKSKNIMFLLEQHGFQMVSRKSRFSCELSLVIRKV